MSLRRYRPDEVSEILIGRGYEKIPLLLRPLRLPGRIALAWYRTDHDEDFILLPVEADGLIDGELVEQALADDVVR
jgi:hypothetical protein